MLRIIFCRVMWLARGTSMVLGLAVMLALVLGLSTVALAAVPGDPFKLGKSNTINKISSLVGSASTALLRIDNNGTGPALDLQVEPGTSPMTVNSDTQVDNLNADKVDGLDSTELVSNLRLVPTDTLAVADNQETLFSIQCDDVDHPGSKAISGGFAPNSGPMVTRGSYPGELRNEPGKWYVSVTTLGPEVGGDGRAYAFCADAAE